MKQPRETARKHQWGREGGGSSRMTVPYTYVNEVEEERKRIDCAVVARLGAPRKFLETSGLAINVRN